MTRSACDANNTDEKNVFTDLNLLIADNASHTSSSSVYHPAESSIHSDPNFYREETLLNFNSADITSDWKKLPSAEFESQHEAENWTPRQEYSCLATRKSGWLNFKNWLANERGKVELGSRRTWKKYWVSLKGCCLHLYPDTIEINEQSVAKFKISMHIRAVNGFLFGLFTKCFQILKVLKIALPKHYPSIQRGKTFFA
jgi:hypothetical protein